MEVSAAYINGCIGVDLPAEKVRCRSLLPACAAGAARLPAHLLATCRLTNAFECLLQCLAPGGPVMAR